MKLEEMRKIAEQRTKGIWVSESTTDYSNLSMVKCPRWNTRIEFEDAKFIALAANTYDVLLEIAEAAKESCYYRPRSRLSVALKKLEELGE